MKRDIELDKLWDEAEGKADQLIYGGDELIENIISEFITNDERQQMRNCIAGNSKIAAVALKDLLLNLLARAKKYKTRELYGKAIRDD